MPEQGTLGAERETMSTNLPSSTERECEPCDADHTVFLPSEQVSAVYRLKSHFESLLEKLRLKKKKETLCGLDVGSGRKGTARMVLEHAKREQDLLALYDPETEVQATSGVHIVPTLEVPKALGGSEECDLVNIAYVLCILPEQTRSALLGALRLRHPQATFTVIDYILRGRERNDILRTLNSSNERKWRERMQDDRFVETRASFDLPLLEDTVSQCGFQVLESHDIGAGRGLVVAEPH